MIPKNKRASELLKHLLIGLVLLAAFFPLYVMLNISFKDNDQFATHPFAVTLPMRFENWVIAWELIVGYAANSLGVSIAAVAATLAFSLCAAYVFARYKFFGKEVLWFAMLGILFMPGIMNLIPLFVLMKDLNLLNSLFGLTVLYTAGGQVFCVFVLRNFIEDMPEDLFEAAEIDGAGPLRQLQSVIIPLTGSILSTLAILRFIASWNDFIEPMIFITDEYKQMLPVGLMRLDAEQVKQWGPLMAGFSLAAIPLVLIFIFTMRMFVKGLTGGAVKG
jgi:ABC-type glycerol-3-phosphate transport system permease component